MRCSQAKRQMSAMLDHDLTFEQEGELQGHLRACPACAEEMEHLTSVRNLLASLPESDPGPSFYEDVRQRIDATKTRDVPEPEHRGSSLGDLIREAFGAAWLRPAVGVAFGVAMGILITTVAIDREGTPGSVTSGTVAEEIGADPTGAGGEFGSGMGPVADIDIGHFDAESDTLDPDATISILDPYYQQGPQGQLAPVVGRNPNDGRDAQAGQTIF